MTRPAFVVQHSPLRADLLPRVTKNLRDPLIVTDPGGELSSAWRCYRECLRVETDASHLVICQDDSVPCPYFSEAAEAAIAAKPDAVIVFCLCAQPATTALAATRALAKRERWVRLALQDWLPTIATSYPVSVARALADWGDAAKPEARGDDSVAGDFVRAHRHDLEVFCTVPSLVEHPDDVLSLIGRRHMSGLNRGRCAKLLVEGDARAIRW